MSISKRLLSVILTVCMIVAMVPATALFAGEAPVVTGSAATIEQGDTSEQTLSIYATGDGVSYGNVKITVPAGVTVKGYQAADYVTIAKVGRGASAYYTLAIDAYDNAADAPIDTTALATFTFTVAEDAEGDYTFGISALDADGVITADETEATFADATVTVTVPSYEGFTVVFAADKTEVTPGDTVTITFKAYNIPEDGLQVYQLSTLFNTRAFAVTAGDTPATIAGEIAYGFADLTTGTIGATLTPPMEYTGKNLVLGYLTYTVLDTAANGEYTIDEIITSGTTWCCDGELAPQPLETPAIVPAVITVSGSEASAYDTLTVEAKASKTEVQPGDTFTVEYKICAIPETGMGGWQFHADFNTEVFEITSFEIPFALENKATYGIGNLSGLCCGTLQLANIYKDAVVGTYTFAVKSTAQDGTYEIGFNVATAGDTFYYQAIDGTAMEMVTYETPAEAPATITVTGGVAQTYTISFVDGETVLATGEYEAGAAVTAPEAPAKAADAQYTYTFAGWSDGTTTYTEIPAASANVTYTPVYTSTVNTYTITWSVNGVETTETYEYGATPSFKGSVAKAADAQYTYRFAGFDPEIAPVTGDATYTATYTTTEVTYTVTWNVGGTTFTETYPYGATVNFPATDKASDTTYDYYFAGWTTGGVTYWAESEGFVVDSGEVDENGDPIYVPAEFPTVTGNVSITAEYSTDPLIWVYGSGMENWSNQTQVLVSVNWRHGESVDVAEGYTYTFTIDGVTYHWTTSSNYWDNGWAIMRFQPCLEEEQWIPENGRTYQIGVVITDNGTVVYDGVMNCVLNADPIVPAAREAIGGKIQPGLYWYYDGAETLTIYGTEMPERLPFSYDAAPWAEVAGYIKTVKFEGYMTQISRNALAHMPAIETVYIPEGVTTMWNDCLAYAGTLKTVYLPSTLTAIKQGTVYASGALTNVYYTGTASDWQNINVSIYNDGITNNVSFCTVTASGEGDGYTWTSYSNGVTIFKGEGATEMANCTAGEQPWAATTTAGAYFFGFKSIGKNALARTSVVKVWIAQGTETVNGDAFAYASALKEVTLPATAALGQGTVFGSNSITTVYYESFPSALTAVASVKPYNDGIKNAENKFYMDDEPTWKTLAIGKYGSGIENWGGATQLLVTLAGDANYALDQVWANKGNYTWVLTIDGKEYAWQPASAAWANPDNLFVRFTPMLYDNFLIVEKNAQLHIQAVEIKSGDEVLFKGTSNDTWTWTDTDPIYPAGGYKLNLSKYNATSMENWNGQTQILANVAHNSVNITNLFANKGNYVWELTIDGTPYRFAPSTNYPWSATNNLLRFEPCVNSTFVPVKDQAYAISLKIYAADGETLLYYTDTVEGFTLPVDPIVPHTHNYVAVVTEPTCTEGGYTTYTCECGDSYVADETAALGHDYVAVVTEPTCTEGGYTTYTCSRCDDSYIADETSALGHHIVYVNMLGMMHVGGCDVCEQQLTEWEACEFEWTETVPATTTSEGVRTGVCPVCNFTKTETIPMLSTGWVRVDENTAYYYDANGDRDTNFSEDGMTYTVEGEQLYGWQEIDGKTYYFKTKEGIVGEKCTGATYVFWVLYNFDEFGVLQGEFTGEYNGAYYVDGERFTGFEDGSYYHKGVLQTGWFEVEGETYYASVKTGKILKGLTYIAGVYYDLDEETGALVGAYNGVIDGWTYVDGVKAAGWTVIDGDTYYFSVKSGVKATGIVNIAGTVYEFTEDGVLVGEV